MPNNEREGVATSTNATTITGKAKVAFNPENVEKGIKPNFEFTFATSFIGFAKNKATGIYEEGEITTVSLSPRYVKGVAFSDNVVLSMLGATKKDAGCPIGNSTIAGFITDAVVTIKRSRFNAGDEYTDNDGAVVVHANDGYNTELVSIKMSDERALLAEKMLIAAF